MNYLIDSDWLVDCLLGRPNAVDLLGLLASDGIAISLISCGEIYEGIYFGRNPATGDITFLELLGAITILAPTLAIMRQFARIRGDLRRLGQLIGDMDILIAATAIERDLTLVTRNRAHFGRIPHLRIYTDS